MRTVNVTMPFCPICCPSSSSSSSSSSGGSSSGSSSSSSGEPPLGCPESPPATITISGWERLFFGAVKTWTSSFGGLCVDAGNIYVKASGPGALEIFDGTLYYNPDVFGGNCGWTQLPDTGDPNFGYVWIEVDDPFSATNQYIWRVLWHVYFDGTKWIMRIDFSRADGSFSNSAYLYKYTGDQYGDYEFVDADSDLGDNPSCYTFTRTTITVAA